AGRMGIDEGIPDDSLQEAPEGPGGIVLKPAQSSRELQQGGLTDVLDVGFLEPPRATPVEDLRRVAIHEATPGCLVGRDQGDIVEQGGTRLRVVLFWHGVAEGSGNRCAIMLPSHVRRSARCPTRLPGGWSSQFFWRRD